MRSTYPISPVTTRISMRLERQGGRGIPPLVWPRVSFAVACSHTRRTKRERRSRCSSWELNRMALKPIQWMVNFVQSKVETRLFTDGDLRALYAIEEACFEPAVRFSRGLTRSLA